jgi:hypothetical protein
VDLAAVSSTPALLLGPGYLGGEFWKTLGLEGMFSEYGSTRKHKRLACAEVISRLVAPAYELRMSGWVERTA